MEDRMRRVGDHQLAHLHMACDGCGAYVSIRKLRLGLCPTCYHNHVEAIKAKTKEKKGDEHARRNSSS